MAAGDNKWVASPVVALFFLAFISLWMLAVRTLRAQARMVRKLERDPGVALRESRWGSATINGVSARNCVKISEHIDGWLIRLMPLFGGGKLWLPRETTRVTAMIDGKLFHPAHRMVVSGEHRIRVYGRLADFFA